MAFSRNLFGTIASGFARVFSKITDIDFIPGNKKGQHLYLKDGDDCPVWLGLTDPLMQKYAYDFCYPVSSVVDALAECDLNGVREILKSKGKGKNDYAKNEWATRMGALMDRPNHYQTWHQFRGQQLVYKMIFGFCPVLPIIPKGFGPEYAIAMINLPPWMFTVIGTKNYVPYKRDKGTAVDHYVFTIYNQRIEYKPEQLFILSDSFITAELHDHLLPQSRLVGLDMAVSNICAAMEADNVLLRKKGPLGFISHDAGAVKDNTVGYLPMTEGEKKELQAELSGYGLSLESYQYAISRTAVKWQPQSFNVTQLGTKDTIVVGEKAICRRYNYKYILYEDQAATFANGEEASKSLYNNKVIPTNERDIQMYNQFFKASDNDCVIKFDFSHIPALQKDEKEKNEAKKILNEGLEVEWKNNLITRNMWREALGYDRVEGDDVYYKDTDEAKAEHEAKINPPKTKPDNQQEK